MEFHCQGLLFDMDGTLIDSTASMTRIWSRWAQRHGIDSVTFIPKIHGMRATDTIGRLGLKGLDPVAEAKIIEIEETEDTEGVVALPGAMAFLDAIPAGKWALVTSAPIKLAKSRLAAAGIPVPAIAVFGEDVKVGKPDPTCFKLGAQRLNLAPSACVAFEDSAAGIAAAAAAGSQVVVITATHHAPMDTPHWAMADYAKARITPNGNGLRLNF